MTLFRFLLRHRRTTEGLLVLTLCGSGCGEAPDTTSIHRGEGEDEATGGAGEPRLRDAGLDAGGGLPGKRGDAGPIVISEASRPTAGPIEKCPGDLVCNRLGLEMQVPSPEAVCQRENLPPRCPASGACADIGLPGAQCISVAVGSRRFSYCQQPCVPPPEPEPEEPPASDAGTASNPRAGSDAGRDAGTPVVDAGRDAGRDAGNSRRVF
jgi:hypothetical protein